MNTNKSYTFNCDKGETDNELICLRIAMSHKQIPHMIEYLALA